jgi:two-component system, OmpR family, phosphate regulon response regulator OmpR
MDTSPDKPHVLVVDDDTRLRELLKTFLSRNGFRVSTAKHAAEARQHLDALDFDLIVLDVMMPGQTGLEFAAELRQSNAVPILMLTAMGEPKDRIAGLEKGVDDYLAKPFEARELLLRIQNVLRRGGASPSGPSSSTSISANSRRRASVCRSPTRRSRCCARWPASLARC